MCERWISEKRLKFIDDDTSHITKVPEFLDFLIDAFLWHMPIPRFSRTFDFILYKNSVKSGSNVFGPSETPDFITVLRDNSLGDDVHAYVTILMILDYETLQKIPIQVAYESNFVKCAKECISEEFSVEFTTILDLLEKFKAHMIQANLDIEDKTFIKVKDVDRALMSDQYIKAHEAFLNEQNRGFSKEFLNDHCYVRNLVDELPEFRIF
jgi:hypothetical protein